MPIHKRKIKKFIGIVAAVTGGVLVCISIFAKKSKSSSVYKDSSEQKNPFEGKRVVLNDR